jgi:RNA polymerase sigma-70 factor (ECF subfamily)
MVARLEACADRVFRLCLHLTGGCHADAEDLAQDTLIAGFASLPRFAGRAQLTTYLHTIAVHSWRRQCLRRERTVAVRESDGGHDDDPLLRLSLEHAIDALPLPLREAFTLVKIERLTHREAARVLGVPQGTVQSRVHDAVHRLRAALTEEKLP